MRSPITMPTVKIFSVLVLIYVGFIMVDLLLPVLTFWWWVPITIAAFAIFNIAVRSAMREKPGPKELLVAVLSAMMVTQAIKWWWR